MKWKPAHAMWIAPALGSVTLIACMTHETAGAAPHGGPKSPQTLTEQSENTDLIWNERTVEHLLNRAGWGDNTQTIQALAKSDPEYVIDLLLSRESEPIEWEPELVWLLTDELAGELGMPREEFLRRRKEYRTTDSTQFRRYAGRWYQSMIDNNQPLIDRMTMFWHGFFPVSTQTVQRKFEVINQHKFLAENSVGDYKALLRGIAHDPAMLWFLDNDTNVKGHPNENLGRELLELFSLGDGNYTEFDVREAARALTGVINDKDTGTCKFIEEVHDDGVKKFLGHEGRFKSNDIVDILLEQDACARWVCLKIITYLEGVEPDPARLESYANTFREADYEVKPVLRRLFLDPEFYREEIIGARVQSPIDFLVGSMRRLRVEPPPYFVFLAGKSLGQGIYDPPSVEGWKEGETWITNESLMQRGNCIGILLGVFGGEFGAQVRNSAADMGEDSLEGLTQMAMASAVQAMRTQLMTGADYKVKFEIASRVKKEGAESDAEIVAYLLEELLAIQPPAETHDILMLYVAELRRELELGEKPLLETGEKMDIIFRRIAHMILSLPEAQLG